LELVQSEKILVLMPRKHIPKDQQWYSTDEWQKVKKPRYEAGLFPWFCPAVSTTPSTPPTPS
jgi:hypothetical protein